ncbi:MAG: hypothetical protein ACKVVP_15550 [Chloroflexota bacterium]
MSTILTTQDRANPLIIDARVDSSTGLFASIFEAIGEIGYCLKLSAQSVSFSLQGQRTDAYPRSSASRLDAWPVDLWVF